MSHTKLYQEGKITRQEYENAQSLKDTGQRGLYKMYERALEAGAKARERAYKRSNPQVQSVIDEAERMS